jgi:DnaJ family protein B protein 4
VVPGKKPGELVFVLQTQPHPTFSRSGADLIHSPVVPLVDALAGAPLTVHLPDGGSITVPVDEILTPGYELRMPRQGLPNPRAGLGARGDLILKVQIKFPQKLSEAQKMLIRAAVFLPEEKAHCDAVNEFRHAFQDPLTGWHTGVF